MTAIILFDPFWGSIKTQENVVRKIRDHGILPHKIPSGNDWHSELENHYFSWKNPLFLWKITIGFMENPLFQWWFSSSLCRSLPCSIPLDVAGHRWSRIFYQGLTNFGYGQLSGLSEKLQETPIFHGKYHWFPVDFPLCQPIDMG